MIRATEAVEQELGEEAVMAEEEADMVVGVGEEWAQSMMFAVV